VLPGEVGCGIYCRKIIASTRKALKAGFAAVSDYVANLPKHQCFKYLIASDFKTSQVYLYLRILLILER
jgi:hypothetical protein